MDMLTINSTTRFFLALNLYGWMSLHLNKNIVQSLTFNEILGEIVRVNPSLRKVLTGNLFINRYRTKYIFVKKDKWVAGPTVKLNL